MVAPATRNCILCDRPPPFGFVFRPFGDSWTLVRCPGCGLVFQDPQPSERVLAESYYHDPEFTQALIGPLRDVTITRAREKLSLLKRAGLLRPGMRVLDVGCSSGAWLEVAASAGMAGAGVEIGERTALEARRRGLDVHVGTLEHCLPQLGEQRFDLITFWDVLEHLRDPRRELLMARCLLNPGGVVAATFPNVEGLYPRASYRLLAGRTGIWEYPELPLHLYDFAPETARLLFERVGYTVVSLSTAPIPFSFYRATSLSSDRLGGGRRALGLRLAFEVLRTLVYPAARLCGRENSLFLAASHP